MDTNFIIFVVLAFIAVIFAIEGIYYWWVSSHGTESKRIQRRLESIANQAKGHASHESILKNRYAEQSSVFNKLLFQLPFSKKLDSLLLQSGKEWTLSKFFQYSGFVFLIALIITWILRLNIVFVLVISLLIAFIPLYMVISARNKRLKKIEEQLPDAIDAICRSLRAGHAFTSAFGLVADELPDPVATEFRITMEENNLGVNINDAMQNLAQRVPITDLRYFVIAVLIQRETGGNLAEILNSISLIIRERFKLIGHVRVLSAEGKMSAWILGLLPFGILGAIGITSPKYLSVLFEDSNGHKLLLMGSIMMIFGILWMRNIIKIRI